MRLFAETLLSKVDAKFWYRPASTTLKYHPAVCNKSGGLIVHIKRVFYFAKLLCPLAELSQGETDEVLVSALLHDATKTGKGEGSYKSYQEHPFRVRTLIPEEWDEVLEIFKESSYLDICGKLFRIFECVELHSGQWTPGARKKPMLEYSRAEMIVHFADCLAADKKIVLPDIDKEVEYEERGNAGKSK